MALPSVHIDKWALFNMLFSAVEVAKTECIGWLFGSTPTSIRRYFRIVNAIPLQFMKVRRNSEVELHDRGITQTDNLINVLPAFKFPRMGGFHSHVEWGDVQPPLHLSDTDIQFMVDWEKKIEIIIGVMKNRQYVLWHREKDGSICGTAGTYFFHIYAYTLIDSEGEKYQLSLPIVAPSSIRFLRKAT